MILLLFFCRSLYYLASLTVRSPIFKKNKLPSVAVVGLYFIMIGGQISTGSWLQGYSWLQLATGPYRLVSKGIEAGQNWSLHSCSLCSGLLHPLAPFVSLKGPPALHLPCYRIEKA